MTQVQLDFAFVADLPCAPVVPKKRASRTKAAVAMPQAAPAVLEPKVAPLPVPAPMAAPTPAPAVLPTHDPKGLEALAMQLEASPDYRVVRRLQPRLQWPSPTSKPVRVLILDTETTGLEHTKDKIVELALLRCDVDPFTGQPVGMVQVYDELEDPGIPIPREVQEITGITNDMVKRKRLDDARIATLLEGVDLVIAHNAGFDRPFCEARLPHFQQLPWACSFADIAWKEQGRSSAGLESLAQQMGWFYDAHRAEMDCHALLAVLAARLPRLPQTGLGYLLEQALKPSYRLMATNAPFDAKDKLKARGYRWNADQKVWSTRLNDIKTLQTEFDWLKENAYHQRSAVVQFEKLDARVRYSGRSGELMYHQL